jgi:transcriptional regulator GlxA family with amidase domain
MEFLRKRRLLRARGMLLGRSEHTVAQVAYSCGFEHLGRFSAQYRAEFGEKPTESLAKRTRARGKVKAE